MRTLALAHTCDLRSVHAWVQAKWPVMQVGTTCKSNSACTRCEVRGLAVIPLVTCYASQRV